MLTVLLFYIVISLIIALVLLFVDLFLLLHVHLICANKYLLTYFLQCCRSIQSLCAWDFEPMHRVWGHASTGCKASFLGNCPPEAGDWPKMSVIPSGVFPQPLS